jgi:hypothetical protein
MPDHGPKDQQQSITQQPRITQQQRITRQHCFAPNGCELSHTRNQIFQIQLLPGVHFILTLKHS